MRLGTFGGRYLGRLRASADAGTDISNNNGAVSVAALRAAGEVWAGVKFSEGDWFQDRFAPDNWRALKANAMGRLAYLFFDPNAGSIQGHVDNFCRVADACGGFEAGDNICADIEVGTGSLHGPVCDLLGTMRDRIGPAPIKYSGPWFTSTRDLEYDDLDEYMSWLAVYAAEMGTPPPGWTKVVIWQYGVGAIPGLTGQFDLDRLLVGVDQLRAIGLKPKEDVTVAKAIIDLSDDDRAALTAAAGAAWPQMDTIGQILSKYDPELGSWWEGDGKAPVVLMKKLCGITP